MPVFKAIVTVTVLLQEKTLELARGEIETLTPEDLAYETSEGGMVGRQELSSIQQVPKEKLIDELKALGNDGTFFGEET